MRMKTILVYADPGHAWAKVSKKELIMLGIANEISGFSYEKQDSVFLEEDSDLSKYIDALKQNNILFKFKEHHTNKRSKIRNYFSYSKSIN